MVTALPGIGEPDGERLTVKQWLTLRVRMPAARGLHRAGELAAVRSVPGIAGAGACSVAAGGAVNWAWPGLGLWAGLGLAGWFLLRLDSRIG